MNESPLEQLIDFRLQQAQETLLEAGMLLSGSAWRGAVNRAAALPPQQAQARSTDDFELVTWLVIQKEH